jgi:NitT/TauT family transport system substrate-binding protein
MRSGTWRTRLTGALLSGLLVLAATGLSLAGEALKKAALIPQWEPQAQFTGYYVALAKGFYRAEGVDMTILRGGPGQPPSRLLREGKAQFGTFFLPTAILERAAGLPLVNLAQFVPHSTQLLIAKKADGIEKPADLAGRKVSLWGPEFQLASQTFFKRHNITIEPVPQGFTVDLFLRGGVAACSAMRYNEYHAILNAGLDPEELTVFDLGAHGLDLPEDGLYVLEDVLRADPGLCRAVVRASVRGWEFAFAHPEAALDIVMSHVSAAHLPTNRMHQKWMLEQLRQVMTGPGDPLGTLTRARYEACGKAMGAAGLVAAVPPYEDFHVRFP